MSVYTVANLNDSGAGSLRAAITSANGDPGSTVAFQAALAGTINLASDLPGIVAGMTIDGSGATIVVDGASAHKAFQIDCPGSAVLIKKLKIQHSAGGDDVGAVRNSYGNVTLENCTLYSNTGGNGGSTWNDDNLTITNCTFDSNTGGSNSGGGAIGTSGPLTVTNCTFYNNHSTSFGGAMVLWSTTVNITNCTFKGNYADQFSGSGFGGALHGRNGVVVNVKNSIFYANTPDQIADFNGAFFNITYSDLIAWSDTGDIDGNPLLGALADNGGFTKTFALGDGSPALGAGTHTGAPTYSQNGNIFANPPNMGSWSAASTPPKPSAPTQYASTVDKITWNIPALQSGGNTLKLYDASDNSLIADVTADANARYDQTGLTDYSEYGVYTVETNGSGDSPHSDTAYAWTIPTAPSGLVATASAGQIALEWDDEGTFNVKRREHGAGSYVNLDAGTNIETNTFTDLTPGDGVTYDYIVTKVDPGGESVGSNVATATTPPTAPEAQTVTTVGSTQLDTDVPALSGGALTYDQQRALDVDGDPGDWVTVEANVTPETTRHNTGLTPSTGYWFRLVANGVGGSTPGAAAMGTTGEGPPSAVITLTPSSVNRAWPAKAIAVLSWTVEGADEVSIDQGIGDVAASGSVGVVLESSKTYTLTASNMGGDTIVSAKAECDTAPSRLTGVH